MEQPLTTLPLSLPQQDIYFEQLLHPGSPVHNIGARIEIRGEIDYPVFEEAYRTLIRQHDAYRMEIVVKDDLPFARFHPEGLSRLRFVDLTQESDPAASADRFVQEEFKKPLPLLEGGPLYQFILVKFGDQSHYLFSVSHHIISDGWGCSLMFQRLVRNYNELLEHGRVVTAYLFSYRDFLDDDINYRSNADYEQDKKYWCDRFSSLPGALVPLLNKPLHSGRKELLIGRDEYDRLDRLAAELSASTFHILLALVFVYSSRYYRNGDIAIGLPVLNRSKSVFRKTVGLFMGINPLRLQVDEDMSFHQLVRQIKDQLKQDYRHQRFPLGKLVKALKLFGAQDQLFTISFSYEKQDYADHFQNTRTTVLPLSHDSEQTALAIHVREFDKKEAVRIDFDYNGAYFSAAMTERMVDCFTLLLGQVLADPSQTLNSFDLVPQKEKELLAGFIPAFSQRNKDKTVVDLFEEQVGMAPSKTAVSDGSVSYTYRQLQEASACVAACLADKEFSKKPVAVLLPRSAHLPVILLGILKTGRPYIPLDPSFPEARLSYIIEHSGCEELVTERGMSFRPNGEKLKKVIYSDDLLHSGHKCAYDTMPLPEDPAYIIYTSGSTGNPKGVEVPHSALANFLLGMKARPALDSSDLLFAVTTCSFDISILEIFLPLVSGATVFMARNDLADDLFSILHTIDTVAPTIIQATPGFFQMLFDAGWKGNKKLRLFCGGDLLSQSLAAKLIGASGETWNMYGPTETTIWSSCKKLLHAGDAGNIGRPILNTSFYLLDTHKNLLPIGATGDLYIGGAGLAKGYYQDAALTSARFIDHPFIPGEKLYHTGDLGRWTEDGEIEFLGRSDSQVKVRGYRIEPGEIEKTIEQAAGIKEAIVVKKCFDDNEPFLAAYVRTSEPLNSNDLLEFIGRTLPAYMVPRVIIPTVSFPLTPNKKVDRKALAQWPLLVTHTNEDTVPLSGPGQRVAAIWKKVLGLESVGTHSNFFHLGGHSLNAVRVVHKINEEFSCALSIKDIFDNPTIHLLTQKMEVLTAQEPIPIQETVPGRLHHPGFAQRNIWFSSQRPEASIAYHMNKAYRVKGTPDIDLLQRSMSSLIGRYEILRTNFTEVDGHPKQFIHPIGETEFSIERFIAKSKTKLEALINQFIHRPFDLSSGLLLRCCFIESGRERLLVFSTHHIIMDGWSLEVLIKEWVKTYNDLLDGQERVEAPGFQYKDFSEWQAAQKETSRAPEFKDYSPKHSFRRDGDGPSAYQGNSIKFEWTKEETGSIQTLAHRQGTTVFSVLASMLQILVYKYSGFSDICMGIVSSGRTRKELSGQLGMFANTIAIRNRLTGGQSFYETLKQTGARLSKALEFENVPVVYPERLFDLLLVYQNPDFSLQSINGFRGFELEDYPLHQDTSRFPLLFDFYDGENLCCHLSYDTSCYESETIAILIEKFRKLVSTLTENGHLPIDEINLKLATETGFENSIHIALEF